MNQNQSSILDIPQLSENLWVYSILLTLADAGIIDKLYTGISKDDIKAQLLFNEQLLDNMLKLLIFHKLIFEHEHKFYLSSQLSEQITEIGLEQFISLIRIPYAQANSFITDVRNKQFKHGWFYTNEKLLQAQGAISEIVATELFKTNEIHEQLSNPDAIFVDIGAGVGKISLKFCELYPNLRAIALEPANAPYLLAKQNIIDSEFANRILLKQEYGQNLNENNKFNVVWLAQGFIIDNQTFIKTVQNIYQSLKPDGALISVTMERNRLPIIQQFVHSIYLAERNVQYLIDLFKQIGFKKVQVLPEYKDSLIPLVAIK